MAKNLNTLPIGALVKDTKTKYNGKPVIFKVIDKNHSGYPSNSVTLMTDRIITLKCFDAQESSNSDGNRRSYGNNRYIHSNLRQWLNSQQPNWYSNKHSKDQRPDNSHVWSNYNEYDNEAGFLTGFSSEMINAILNTSLTATKSSTDGGGVDSFTDKIFLASCTEMGLSGDQTCGTHFNIFNSDAARQAKPTAECVNNSEYTNSSLNANSFWYYWLRDAYASNSYNARRVHSSGVLSNNHAYSGHYGVRPLCNLKSSILVSDTTDSDGAYTIIWNRPPSKPTTIETPEHIRGGQNANISWSASSDPDNNLAGYILERQVNGGSYTQIYKGINRSFNDNITFGWQNVRYRVKAYDANNSSSEYRVGPLKTVINNTPPKISGNDENLGEKTAAFNKGYSVSDVDAGQVITVTEKIDEGVKRTFTATSGQNYSFNVTADEWLTLGNGNHTLKIIADDDAGGQDIRTITFSKNEDEIELTLENPLPADDMLTKALVNLTSQIPVGATLQVFVCNNGNDDEPTWEDVTNAVKTGGKIFFENKTKTAAEWGFNVKVKIKRNNALGDCYIAAIGGNFE